MLKNNRWYKYKNGKSIIFKKGFYSGFGYFYMPVNKKDHWDNYKKFYFKEELWEEITSPKVVLEAINKGMKSKGYHNDIEIEPFCQVPLQKEVKKVKLKDLHFDFNSRILVDNLMYNGELWLTDNEIYSCVLKDGKLSKNKSTKFRPSKFFHNNSTS